MNAPFPPSRTTRQRAMAAFAKATQAELEAAISSAGPLGHVVDLRPAESGLIMVRGRTGGTGDAFNLGEAMVSRASVRLEGGVIGHAYRLGHDIEAARLAAIADALWQMPEHSIHFEEALIRPVEERLLAASALSSRQAAATRVDFFTMVRGED